MAGTDFIAETDVSGVVLWVWRIGPRERVARPVDEAHRHLHELATARLHGADAVAFADWFQRQAAWYRAEPRA